MNHDESEAPALRHVYNKLQGLHQLELDEQVFFQFVHDNTHFHQVGLLDNLIRCFIINYMI